MPIFAALATALPSLISAGAGIAGNISAGNNSAKAIRDATSAQNAASQQAIGAINGNNQTNANLFAPYLNSGSNALSQLDILLGLGAPSMSPAQNIQPPATADYAAYVRNNPDLMAQYQAQTGYAKGRSMADYGQQMWTQFDNSGRTYTPFGAASGGWNPSQGQQSLDANQQQAQAPAQGAPQASGADQQQSAIDQLKASPLYQSLFRNGEQTVLANGAATGGLRGGNTAHSLYNVGNDTLAQVIQQQVANLGGLAGAGQNAAGSLAGYNTQGTGALIGQLNQQGANTAGGIIGGANAQNSMISGLTNGLGSLLGNSQLLSALGLGGGIKQSASPLGSALGSSQSVGSNYVPNLNLNSTLPSLAF